METIRKFIDWLHINISLPDVNVIDVIEIIIIAFVAYRLLVFIRSTRAWNLVKGLGVIAVVFLLAEIFGMNTIIWIIKKVFSVALIALVIVFQPELRSALEKLGRKNFFAGLFSFDTGRGMDNRIADRSINEITKAVFEMAKVKTGALIVLEKEILLNEYSRTGIDIDSEISSQLILNIFEHNTPLHDGAVLIRGDRILSATCYLPLSDNLTISKELGTRHRAALGISEVTDSLTIVVSEETGMVSVAETGKLIRDLDADGLKEQLKHFQSNKKTEESRFGILKGRIKNEKDK